MTNWLAERDALLARLSAVEAERDHFQTIAYCLAMVWKWAAEDRVEAAEQSPFVPCDCADGFLWDPRVDGNIVPCPRCARAALSAGGEGGG